MASNRPQHFEIPGDDPEKLIAFYRDLFGWEIHKVPIPGFEYWICRTGTGPGIDGAVMRRMHGQHHITNYTTVENIDAMLEKAEALGAKIAVPKSPVPDMGYVAIAIDPQNNPVGFWQDDKKAQ